MPLVVSGNISTGVARLFAVGLSVDEYGDSVEQEEECDHEERDPRVPARPGSFPLSGGRAGVEVHAGIFSSNSEAPLPGAVTDEREMSGPELVWPNRFSQ
jgi:hypothetical protein